MQSETVDAHAYTRADSTQSSLLELGAAVELVRLAASDFLDLGVLEVLAGLGSLNRQPSTLGARSWELCAAQLEVKTWHVWDPRHLLSLSKSGSGTVRNLTQLRCLVACNLVAQPNDSLKHTLDVGDLIVTSLLQMLKRRSHMTVKLLKNLIGFVSVI